MSRNIFCGEKVCGISIITRSLSFIKVNNCTISCQKSVQIPKGIIRIFKSKDRQHNGQTNTKPNNDLHNIKQKANDRVTRTPQKTGGELRCSGRISNFWINVYHEQYYTQSLVALLHAIHDVITSIKRKFKR